MAKRLCEIVISPTAYVSTGAETVQFTATGLYSDGSTKDLTLEVLWFTSVEYLHLDPYQWAQDWQISSTGLLTIPGTAPTQGYLYRGSVSASHRSCSLYASVPLYPYWSWSGFHPQTDHRLVGSVCQMTKLGHQLPLSGIIVTWHTGDAGGALIVNYVSVESPTGVTSQQPGIVSVSGASATAVSAGTANLYRDVTGSAGGVLRLDVGNGLSTLHLPSGPIQIPMFSTQKISAFGRVNRADGNDLVDYYDLQDGVDWTSDDTSVATVDGVGNVAAQSLGTTYIHVTDPDTALTTSCQIVVIEAPDPLMSIEIQRATDTLQVGTSQQYTAIGTFQSMTTRDITADVTWSVS